MHGVLAIPELHRVYASANGSNELVVIDDSTLQIIARAHAGDYPDGVAYASRISAFANNALPGLSGRVTSTGQGA